MKIIIPTKLYEFDFVKNKFKSVIIDREYDLEEKWKPLYFRGKDSGYQVSNFGNVKKPNGEKSPLYYDKNGYTRFCLYIPRNNPVYKNRKRIAYPYKTHRAVAELFVPNLNPSEFDLVMHKNDIPDCNFAVNLCWGNAQMNMTDKHLSDRFKYLKGTEKSEAIFNEHDVRSLCDCIFVKGIKKTDEIIKYFNYQNRDNVFLISFTNLIHNVKAKHCWRHVISEYTEV